MPDVPADHVGDRERALHHRADLVALCDVLPPPRLGAPPALGSRVLRVDLGDLLVGVRLDRDRVVLPSLAAFLRSVRIISRYWPDSSAPVSSRNTSAVHSWIARLGELARLVEHGDRARCGGTCAVLGRSGAHHSRALAE